MGEKLFLIFFKCGISNDTRLKLPHIPKYYFYIAFKYIPSSEFEKRLLTMQVSLIFQNIGPS